MVVIAVPLIPFIQFRERSAVAIVNILAIVAHVFAPLIYAFSVFVNVAPDHQCRHAAIIDMYFLEVLLVESREGKNKIKKYAVYFIPAALPSSFLFLSLSVSLTRSLAHSRTHAHSLYATLLP
ncbi:hypothetical protein BX666DRAFT_427680 [Dichotomocladium elegans]|nr:hypothetical protein BX666DRAFT_427680 [Dichotomocladium elegans]